MRGFLFNFDCMTTGEIKKIAEPILRKHGVSKAAIFGSMASQTYTDESDVDILIELDESYSMLDIIRIKFELEDALGRKVDLVEYQAIKPALKKYILDNPVPIYG
jgi:predicted nucleotidyltransferase